MILSGDIGGTKTLLGLFERTNDRPRLIEFRAFPTLEYDSLTDIIRAFTAPLAIERIDVAAFGVAGPVVHQRAILTNVPWRVDGPGVAADLDLDHLTLLNDLEAMAYSVPVLRADECELLQEGVLNPDGHAALIAAGTGLGEAFLHRVNGVLMPSPSESGHTDFAPRTPQEVEFLRYLVKTYGRAEWEQVLSGRGLINLHRFLHDGRCEAKIDTADAARAPALVTASALAGHCPHCVTALDMFVEAYGSEAGNLALRGVATAGLFVGGGIAPKILPALRTGRFLQAFRSKPPMDGFLEHVPVAVILDDRAALLGAAVYAASHL